MDADERLTALKKAYADIILNTAKEAAARIMVSERRALRFQHELRVAKEESLQMLMRLKQMMDFKDSKIHEAENTSSIQLGQIEELEAQLHEAEDIVKDLREELREVEAKLESVSKNKIQHLDDMAAPEATSEDNRQYTSQCILFPHPESRCEHVTASDVRNMYLNQGYEGYKCYNDIIHTGNSYLGNPDIPSIILGSKEPELYRNGCTQRIRACERNVSNGELLLSGQINHETRAREDEEGEKICTKPTYETDDTCATEKKGRVPADRRLNISKRPCRRGSYRAARSKKNWLHPVGERIFTKPTYETDNMCTSEKKGRLLADSKLRCTSKRPYRRSYRASGHNKNCYPPEQSTKTNVASAIICLSSPNQVINNAQSIGGPSEMTPTEASTQLGCAETTEVDREFDSARGVQNTINKDDLLMHKLLPTTQEIELTQNSEVPIGRMNLEKVDVPLVNSEESKASDTSHARPSQPVSDRIIKYTFQRKRKRETLSNSDGNASLENSTLKRNMEEKQTDSLEPQNSSLITESSRDSRRLAQVAHQLISLSEKKWWQ